MCRAARPTWADAVWLAKVAERGMSWPSLVQPPEIRRPRDLTRYRRALVQDRTRGRQRGRKAARGHPDQDLGGVDSYPRRVSGPMMEALICGQRDPRALAALAKGALRARRPSGPRRRSPLSAYRRHDWRRSPAGRRGRRRTDRRDRRGHDPILLGCASGVVGRVLAPDPPVGR
jgi:hypothetical protein